MGTDGKWRYYEENYDEATLKGEKNAGSFP